MAVKRKEAREISTDHLATIRGDFFGSKSSRPGSNPGYWTKSKRSIHYKLHSEKRTRN